MFNLDNLLGKKETSGKVLAVKPPDKGAARFFFLAYTHFAKLVGLNMLFLLFCVPVITIPAALSGISRVNMLLVRQGTSNVWGDFIGEFKSSFLKSLPLGLLCAFLFADAALCIYLGGLAASAGTAAALLIAALILYIMAIPVSCYIFALLSIMTLRNADILRDAVSLILLKPKAALYLLLFIGGGVATAAWCLPYSVPVISVIGPSILSLAACTIMNGPIQNCIIDQSSHPK